MLQRLSALFLFCCLLAGDALALGGEGRCSCCSVRPCCQAMQAGAACAMHRTAPGVSCTVQPADREAAIFHVHRSIGPRPAVFPRLMSAPPSRPAAHRPEPAAELPDSLTTPPETPPPRLLTV
jgi:hypothetical protein